MTVPETYATVHETASIRDTMAAIEVARYKLAVIVNHDGRLLGLATDGDIRRGLMTAASLNTDVAQIMVKHPILIDRPHPRDALIDIMTTRKIKHLLEVDSDRRPVAVHVLDDLMARHIKPNWVVLMAGGLGSRLQDLTKSTPKPLIDVGGRPMLETILLQFKKQGFVNFYISVNYLGDMIEDYFGDGSKWGITITYLREEKRTGTAGSLHLLPQKPDAPFFVMNGDILTALDPSAVLKAHDNNACCVTMCVREIETRIDFGVVETDGIRIQGMREKPVYHHLLNAGIYVLSPNALDFLPDEESYLDMPTLIQHNINDDRLVSPFLLKG
ncbi:MAG: nucleotidyltransferase family protein, partial [Pseudomonadota bacterium]